MVNFFGDTAMNKEKGTIDKTLKMVWVQNIPMKHGPFWKLPVVSACDIRECLFCCDIAELTSCMIKKCKETYDSPFWLFCGALTAGC